MFVILKFLYNGIGVLLVLLGLNVVLSYPSPQLAFITNNDPISSLQPMSFDASMTTDTAPNAVLHFFFDFGDGSETVHNSRSSIAIHQYSKPGLYLVTMRVNNRADIHGNLTTIENVPAPTISEYIQVFEQALYEFVAFYQNSTLQRGATILIDSFNNETIVIYVQVMDPKDPSEKRRQQLTSEFALLAEYPTVETSNGTHKSVFEFSQDLDPIIVAWRLVLDTSRVITYGLIFGVLRATKGVIINLNTVKDSTFSLMFALEKRQLGENLSMDAPSVQGASIVKQGFAPTSLNLVSSVCSSDTSLLLLVPGATYPYLNGAMVISTHSAFSEQSIHDLLFSNSSTDEIKLQKHSLCKPDGKDSFSFSANCSTIAIITAAFSEINVFVVSTRGIAIAPTTIVSFGAGVNNVDDSLKDTLPIEYIPAASVHPDWKNAVDAGDEAVAATFPSLYIDSKCQSYMHKPLENDDTLSPTNIAIFTFFPAVEIKNETKDDVGTKSHNATTVGSRTVISSNPLSRWASIDFAPLASRLPQAKYGERGLVYRVVGVTKTPIKRRYVFLLGIHDNDDEDDDNRKGVGEVRSAVTAVYQYHRVSRSGSWLDCLGCLFSVDPTVVVTDIVAHASGEELFILGSSVLVSTDGGGLFRSVLKYDIADERAIQLVSSTRVSSYAVRSSTGRIHYGRSGVHYMAAVMRSINENVVLRSLFMNDLGQLYVLELARPNFTTLSPEEYPVGVLVSADGTMAGGLSKKSLLRRFLIPVQSLLPQITLPPPPYASALAIIGLSAAELITPSITLRNSIVKNGKIPYKSSIIPWNDDINLFPGSRIGLWVQQNELIDSGQNIRLHRDSGEGRIWNTDSFRALISIETKMAPESEIESPALFRELLLPTLSNVEWSENLPLFDEAVLSLDSGLGPGWLYTDVGKTIVTGSGSFLITHIINETHVNTTVLLPKSPIVMAMSEKPGTWHLFDFRGYFEEAGVSADQLLSVSSSGITNSDNVPSFVVILSPGNLEFSTRHEGMVLVLTDGYIDKGWGVVSFTSIDGTSATVYGSKLESGNYSIGEWRLYVPELPYNLANISPPSPALHPWSMHYGICPYHELNGIDAQREVFLDLGESFNFSVMGVEFTEGELSVRVSNAGILSVDTSLAKTQGFDGVNYAMNVTISDRGISGASIVSVLPTRSLLTCPTTKFSINVFTGCPPSKITRPFFPFTQKEFLYGTTRNVDDMLIFRTMPPNYRPPSASGRAIPLSANIYNAHPELPRYEDNYEVSKVTGAYTICAGVSSRAECGCTDDLRAASSPNSTDCQDRVQQIYFQEEYEPKFIVFEDNNEAREFTGKYRLREVNDRSDYCPLSAPELCGDMEALYNFTYSPETHEKIVWKGTELFHFEMTVITEANAYCVMNAEFKVWTVDAPLQSVVLYVIMAIVAVLFGVCLFAIYLWYYNTHKDSY